MRTKAQASKRIANRGANMEKAAFLFDVVEWQTAIAIRLCSIGAKGLYMELLTITHRSEPYGVAQLGDRVIPEDRLPWICGCSTAEQFTELLQELLDAGLVMRTPSGVLATKEMTVFRRRTQITEEVRAAVMERDGGQCRYCGILSDRMTMDHVVPWSRGGSNEIENLASACVSCNAKKGDRTPEEAGMVLRPTPTA